MRAVYVGMGSNLGDRGGFIAKSIHEIGGFARVHQVSSMYETDPLGVEDHQPKYLNAVIEIETNNSAQEVLDRLGKVEMDMGRIRRKKWAPRQIDLDLLAFGDVIANETRLKIPHPRMHERRFVLQPLQEIAPNWIHPVFHLCVKDLLKESLVANQRVYVFQAGANHSPGG